MKTDDLLDRPDSFEARLRAGLDHIAGADPVANPGLFDPDAMSLQIAPDPARDRRRVPLLAAASVAAVTIGGLALLATRDTDPPAANQPAPITEPSPSGPAATSPTVPPSSEQSFGSSELCDDAGCDKFEPLPVVTGAATFYRSDTAAGLGAETIHLDRFEHLTRCTELAADGTSCARIEGIAGVGIVDYVTTGGSTAVEIGTTFTTISPTEYAQQWGPTQGGDETSAVVVRGNDGIRYSNEDRTAVVWQESAGVLVWVAVDATLDDQLLEIAEGVDPVDAVEQPTSIPHRVVVPGLGDPWDAEDNDGDGVLVGLHDGVECVGIGYIDHCGTSIEDRVIVRTAGDALRVAGSTPADVVKVRVTTSADVGAEVDTVTFNPYTSRFFNVFVGAGDSLTVEWLDANDDVVDEADVTQLVSSIDAGTGKPAPSTTIDTLPGVDTTVLVIVDASGRPGAADSVSADLQRRGYTVVLIEPATQQFEQSMLMPVGGTSDGSGTLLDVLGLGGFDTWTPSLVVNPIPDNVTDVVVLGADGLSTMAPPQVDSSVTTLP